jgi:ATP-binding cassette subfamily B protein
MESNNGIVRKDKTKKKTASRLWRYVQPDVGRIIAGFTALLFNSITNLSFPWIMGNAVDGNTGPAVDFIMKTAGVFFVGSVASWVRVYCIGTATDNIANRLRKELFNAFMDMDLHFFHSTRIGELINVLEKDVQEASETFTEKLGAGLRSVNSSIFGSMSLFATSPLLCGVSLSMVPLVGVGAMTLSKFSRRIADAARATQVESMSFAIERFSRYSTVRLNDREAMEKEAFAQYVEKSTVLSSSRHMAQGSFMGFLNLATNVSLVGVLHFGGQLVAKGALTNGALTRFAIQVISCSLIAYMRVVRCHALRVKLEQRLFFFLRLNVLALTQPADLPSCGIICNYLHSCGD